MLARHDYHQALFNGQVEEVITAIKEGAVDPNEMNSNGLTLLQAAAQEGRDEVILWLLLSGAEVDRTTDLKPKTPFQYAEANGYILTTQLLAACGANKQGHIIPINEHTVSGVFFWFVSHYRSTDSLDLLKKIILNVAESRYESLIQGVTELAAYLNHPSLAIELFNLHPFSRVNDTIRSPACWAMYHNDMELFKSLAPNNNDLKMALWYLNDPENPKYNTILELSDDRSELESSVANIADKLSSHLAEIKHAISQRSYQSIMQGNKANLDDYLKQFLHQHFDYVALYRAIKDDLQSGKFTFSSFVSDAAQAKYRIANLELVILREKLSQWIFTFNREDQREFIRSFPNDRKVALAITRILEDRLSDPAVILRLKENYFKQFFISYLFSKNDNQARSKDLSEDARRQINSFISKKPELKNLNKDFYLAMRFKYLSSEKIELNDIIPRLATEIHREMREQTNLQDLCSQALVLLNGIDNHMKKEGCYKLKARNCHLLPSWLVSVSIAAVFIYFFGETADRLYNIENRLRHDPQPLYGNLSCLDYQNGDSSVMIIDKHRCIEELPEYCIDLCLDLCQQMNAIPLSQFIGLAVGEYMFIFIAGIHTLCLMANEVRLNCLSRSDATLPNNLLDQVKKIITNGSGLDELSAKNIRDKLSQYVDEKTKENSEKEKSIAGKNVVRSMIHKHFGLFSLPQVPVVRREFHRIDIAESKEEDISSLREPLLSVQRGYGSI